MSKRKKSSKANTKNPWAYACYVAAAQTRNSRINAERNRMMKRVMKYTKPTCPPSMPGKAVPVYGKHDLKNLNT